MASSNVGFIDVSVGLRSPEVPSLGGGGLAPGEGVCVCMPACACMVPICATITRLLPGVLGDSGQPVVHPLDILSFPGCLSIG